VLKGVSGGRAPHSSPFYGCDVLWFAQSCRYIKFILISCWSVLDKVGQFRSMFNGSRRRNIESKSRNIVSKTHNDDCVGNERQPCRRFVRDVALVGLRFHVEK
jgi:hypothetical protein